eukprot:9362640-Prorocentrum_lima.AAC.1
MRSNALQTTWSSNDFSQLRAFIDGWRSKCSRKRLSAASRQESSYAGTTATVKSSQSEDVVNGNG